MDPRYQQIRYIGGTVQGLEKRLKQHIYLALKQPYSNIPSYRWIRKLNKSNIKPVIELLCVCDGENFKPEETAWIWFCRQNGCNLLNILDGGDGVSHGHKLSEETKKKMSESAKGKNKGRKHTEEARKNMSLAHIGNLHSEQQKINMALAQKTRRKEEKAKGIQQKKVKLLSEEKCSRRVAWNKGIKQTPEQVEVNRQSHMGYKHSEEAKLKMSLASKKYWREINAVL
jgi:group I intron endonuclease